jgi:thioester reductase-like protein
VDFNLSVSSFEGNIRALRNLIDLALLSPHAEPPRLLFISSVGVFRSKSARMVLEMPVLISCLDFSMDIPAAETQITDPEVVIGSGYVESKWVCERVLTAAAETTSLRPITVRVGQMTGDRNGSWNEKEWFPAVVKSAKTLKCMPNFGGVCSTLMFQLLIPHTEIRYR